MFDSGAFTVRVGRISVSIWGGFKTRCGAHLHFDWGAYGEFIRSAEIGLMADAFIRDVPILADNEMLGINNNQNIFLNLFVNLRLGKRK